MGGGGEAGLDEVAAGGGFPVDHFAAGKDAGEFAELEVVVELAPGDAAGGGNGFVDGAWPGERDGERFDGFAEGLGGVERAGEVV